MMEAAKPIVRLQNVSKRFGKVVALEAIDLNVLDGEILTLLGPSGCGKSTLMRLVAGFDKPTQGSIEIRGQDVTANPPHKRPVNLVFQRYALFPHLDVFDNVAFGLRLKKLPVKEVTDRVFKFLDIVQLRDYAYRWTNELSGGQAQRVALARALANEPAVLLLDEPLAALDLKIRQQMLVELKRIHTTTKTTFIYVTHDQDEAMILSDRVVLMNAGKIVQIDEPERIYAKPNCLFAARFLGDTNIFPASIECAEGSGVVVESSLGKFAAGATQQPARNATHVSIRPENIELSSVDDPTAHVNQIDGMVADLTYIGSRVIYDVAVADGILMRVQEPRPVSGLRFHQGDHVKLRWQPESMVLLAE